jgi:two-component system, response regulator YesN
MNCYISMLIEHICLNFRLSLENKVPTEFNIESNNAIINLHNKSFIINNTTQFIRDNYEKALTLNILASNSYCNASYLSHIFKEKMNISITKYINNIRIQKAKELIDVTNKSITDICMWVGFNDLGYFGRVFKNIIGISPKEYRDKNA